MPPAPLKKGLAKRPAQRKISFVNTRDTFTIFGLFLILSLPITALQAAESSDAATTTPSNPTAYTALRAVQKALGDKALERVVEVTGREGVPQPYLWRVTLKEPTGTREVDVAGGKVSTERTVPGKSAPDTGTLHLHELNLDSSGAFDAADAQARKVRVRFDSLNYTLLIGENGKPAWTLELFNRDGNSVGKMHLAAHDGTIASIEGRLGNMPAPAGSTATATPAVTNANPPAVERRVPTPQPSVVIMAPGTGPTTTVVTEQHSSTTVVDDGEDSGFFTRAGRTIDHTNHTVQRSIDQTNETVKRSLRHTGATIQRFFVGHSDLDRDENKE